MNPPLTLDVTQKAFLELESKLMDAGRRHPVGPDGAIDMTGVAVRRLQLGGEKHKHTCKNRAASAIDRGDTIGELCEQWGIDRPVHHKRTGKS